MNNKDKLKTQIHNWLNTTNPPEKKLLISCGNTGAIIALKQNNDWILTWADKIILYSDINNHPIKPRKTTTPTDKTYKCHCGRQFTKQFALTNHQKKCKQ